MNQKVTVTLKRFYFKEVKIEVNNELLKGMNHEEISDYLIEEWSHHYDEDALFDKAELDDLEVDIGGTIQEDTDRYDIYENGKQVFGGHL
tara:strand:- start:189 stop:458 length:270 start_codon:yes stop_codon:yes gene_type:complete